MCVLSKQAGGLWLWWLKLWGFLEPRKKVRESSAEVAISHCGRAHSDILFKKAR